MANSSLEYLVIITFQPTQTGHENHVAKQPLIVACPSIYQAVKELLLLPMDQFHATTAQNNSMDHFIDQALIYDLHTGQLAGTIINSTDLNYDGQLAVSLEVRPRHPDKIFNGDSKGHRKETSATPYQLPLMNFYAKSNCLVPTPHYDELFDSTLHQCIAPDVVINPGEYCASFKGRHLNKPRVEGDQIKYPTVVEYHFYDDLASAFAKFISLPSLHFDESQLRGKEMPYHFTKGLLSRFAKRPEKFAEMYIVPPDLPDAQPQQSGRFLKVYPNAFDVLLGTGIDTKGKREVPKQVNVQMDYWMELDDPCLIPTKRLVEMLANIAAYRFRPAHVKEFETEKVTVINSLSTAALKSAKQSEMAFHLHTNDFSSALFELTHHSLTTHDPQQVLLNDPEALVLSGKIMDRRGNTIMAFADEKEANSASPGIFLAIHSDWEKDPVFQTLFPFQLSQQAESWQVKKDDMIYFQIGYYQDGKLLATIGYQKFQLLQKANFMQQQLQSHPHMVMTEPGPSPSDACILQLEWELQISGQPTQLLKSQEGYDTSGLAMVWFFNLHEALFTGKAITGEHYSLRLKTAEVLEGPERHKVLIAQLNNEKNPSVDFYFHSLNASQTIKDIVAGQKGMSPRNKPDADLKHRVRAFRPEGKGRQHKPGGP